jgi:hypothetical protein
VGKPTSEGIVPFIERDVIEELCDYVANGGTLARYAVDNDIPYRHLRKWLKGNEYNMSLYEDAVALRDDRDRQLLCDMVMQIARFDPKTVFSADGSVLPIDEWPSAARAALSGIDVVPGTNATKVRFANRLEAVKLIGRELGIFSEKLQVTQSMTIADLVSKAHGNKKSSTGGSEG